MPLRHGDPLRLGGDTFLKHFVLPNFCFHGTAAHALLQQAGVEIGKGDYLGG